MCWILIFNDLGVLFHDMIGKVVRTVETLVPMYCNAIASEALMADECFSTVDEWTDSIGKQLCELLGDNYIGVEPPEGSFFPWRYAIDEPAPKDDLIPEADSHSAITEFMKALAFLDGDTSEVESRYKAWIETNVTSSLLGEHSDASIAGGIHGMFCQD